MSGNDYTPDGPVFVDMTAEVDAMLAAPETAAFIEARRPAREAMNLAAGVQAAAITVIVNGLD